LCTKSAVLGKGQTMRVDGRAPDEMRPVRVSTGYLKYAEGSVLIEIGETRVICSASVDNKVPPHIKDTGQGWITAEYAMLPRASKTRIMRDSMRGSVGGRSHEIQRLIGRSLRTVVDLQKLGERTIIIDCDVLQADGGTRCVAITGAFVALVLALQRLREEKKIGQLLVKDFVAATSVGIVEGRPVLDLCYLEDAQAEVDMNVVMTGSGKFVEIQGTAESEPFDVPAMNQMLDLARKGINELIQIQRTTLKVDSFE
jgi:ribonuclease PH